ncbi:ABC transporter permease [Staphylococcus equorum]|uniref:ABC transporter permease n=1 Tax=Staphylococcus equorum TaxID=246432 RepID=UPI000D1CDB9F|nr:ABC transporter permease [Staphylococcus equorum]MDG0823950.1 ABC transporter permease [Staphylococcus equorum]PTE29017.1 ABC transporter permease [Staphylococcus equorum]PTE81801.1 ABC transporter permease [Staphylococcus equorum]
MRTLQLFRIYHSFLLKKWHLFLYLVLIIIGLFSVLLVIQQFNQDDSKFRIGVVDRDQSTETALILKSMGNGTNLGKDISIKRYNKQEAHQLLKARKLEGYYVFEKGMTKSFYKNGNLPISVYTYDKQSTKSLVINQLTDSVYNRLMLSMGGGLAYTSLAEDAGKEDTMLLLTDLLFTGLNRTGGFDYQPVQIYDTASYYVITGYLASIFIFALSLFSILKMNQVTALKSRLSMYHFSFEKLTLIRSLFTLFYTSILAVVGLFWMLNVLPNDFESYNWSTLVIQLIYYILMLIIWLTIIDLISFKWMNYILKSILSLVILLLSGLIIPTIYFKHLFNGIFTTQPFSFVTNQMLEIILNNYILETPLMFYISLLLSFVVLIFVIVRRYRR